MLFRSTPDLLNDDRMGRMLDTLYAAGVTEVFLEVAGEARRAFLVSLLHRQGVREKKAALEALAFNPLAALRFLGLYAV